MDIEQLIISPTANNNSNGEYDEQGSATPLEPAISLQHPHGDNNYYSRYPHQQARTTTATTIYSMPEMSPSMHRPPTLAPRNGQESRLPPHHHPAVTGGTHTQTPNRRMAHILSEQKRRENINSGFEELKSIVPSCHGCADSKAVILRKAVHYIQNLESEIEKLKRTGPTAMLTSNTPAASPIMHTSKTSSSSCISSSLNGVVGDVTTAKSGLSRNGNGGGVTSVFSLNDPPPPSSSNFTTDHHHHQHQHQHHHHAYQWSPPQTIANGATNDNHRMSNNPPRRNTDGSHYTRHHYHHHPHHHRPYEQPNGARYYDTPSLTKCTTNHRHDSQSSEGMLSSASSTSSSSSDDGGEHAPPPPSLIKIEGTEWGGCGANFKFGPNYRIGNSYFGDVPFPSTSFTQK